MPEPIEQLYVELGADASKLLKTTKDSVRAAEKELGGLEKQGKKTFDESTKSASRFGDYISGALTGAIVSFIAQFTVDRIVNFFKTISGAAVQANSQFEVFETQFETLLGSAGAAKERLDELARFGVETPFELPEVVNASRVLQTFGGTALATGDNLRLIGDIASSVNQPFQDVAFWIGRMYSAMQAGQPFGEASSRLQEMAAISGDTRVRLEEMQKAGASGAELWSVFAEEVDQFSGGMERLSQTLQGIKSNLQDFQGNLLRVGGEPYFEETKESAQRLLDILNKNSEPLEELATALGKAGAAAQGFGTSQLFDALESIESENVSELADSIERLTESTKTLAEGGEGTNLNPLIESITTLLDIVTTGINIFNNLNDKTEKAGFAFDFVRGVLNQMYKDFVPILGDLQKFTEEWEAVNNILEATTGVDISGFFSDLAESTETEAQKNREMADAYRELGEAREASADSADEVIEASEEIADAFEKEKEKAKELALEYADQVEKRDAALAENAEEHAENIAEIEQENADNVAEINQELADELADIEKESAKARADAHDDYADTIEDLEKEVAKRRRDILDSTKDELADLEAETDRALADERENFQKDEKRETEDHLKEMRRLREDYLFNLEDAVGARDARAIVDLRRQYEQERATKEQDFQDNRSREKEDQDARLEQIREAEDAKAQALLEAQENELLKLQEFEEEKRQAADEKRQESLLDIDEAEAEKVAKAEEAHAEALAKEAERFDEAQAAEQERFDERNAKAQEALDKWLEDQAKALADSEEINKEGAAKIFEALDSTFGLGGKIDKMLDAFEQRSKTRMVIEVGIEESFDNFPSSNSNSSNSSSSSSSNQNVPNNPNAANFFAKGGRIIANKPTVAVFGEGGREEAIFRPLDGGVRPNLETSMPMMGQSGQLDVNVRFEDLPADIDQGRLEGIVSTIFVEALQQAGFDTV